MVVVAVAVVALLTACAVGAWKLNLPFGDSAYSVGKPARDA